MCEVSLAALWQKKKMLGTNIFSPSPNNVSKSNLLQGKLKKR
jgi:hypothetical protein